MPNEFFPIFLTFFAVLAIYLIAAHSLKVRERKRSALYRIRYQQLIYQVEVVVYLAQELATLFKRSASRDLLHYYEECLRALEFFLHGLFTVSPVGQNPDNLAKPRQLLTDAYQKFYTLREWLRSSQKEAGPNLPLPFSKALIGCFFCSRPVLENAILELKVLLDKKKVRVKACPFCASELKQNGSVRVLQVLVNGVAKHWSEVPEYVPEPNFWSKPQRTSLKLIHSRSSYEI